MSDGLNPSVYGTGLSSTLTYGVDGEGLVPNLSKVGGSTTGIKDIILDSSAQLVLPPIIPVMIQGPLLYKNNDRSMYEAISLLMTHLPTEISGIDVTTALESHEGPESRTSQTVSTAGRQTLEQPSPSFTLPELNRSIVWEIIGQWFEDISALGTGAYGARFDNPGDPTLSQYSCVMAFIQPDQTYLPDNILNGNLIAGMFPKDRGEFGMQKSTDHNAPTRTVSFTGYSLWTPSLRSYLVEVARTIGIDKYRKLSTQETTPSTAAAVDASSGASGVLNDIING